MRSSIRHHNDHRNFWGPVSIRPNDKAIRPNRPSRPNRLLDRPNGLEWLARMGLVVRPNGLNDSPELGFMGRPNRAFGSPEWAS